MLYLGCPETSFFHPGRAITAGIVETIGGFDQHIQAHQQPKSIRGAIIVDNAFVDDIGTVLGEGLVSLANQASALFRGPSRAGYGPS